MILVAAPVGALPAATQVADEPAAAGVTQPNAAGRQPPTRAPKGELDGGRTTARLLRNLGSGMAGVWSTDSLSPAIVWGAAAAGATFADAAVRDEIADPGSTIGKGGQLAGGAAMTSSVAVGLFVAGRFSSAPRFRAATYDMLCATIVNQLYTHGLKLAVARERPSGGTGSLNSSFPSGHAANAFAWATVIERYYGWKGAVAGYTLASVIGVSRIQENKHWLSDVVGGAAVGYLSGRAVVRMNGRPSDPTRHAASVSVAPRLGRRLAALSVSVTF